jgi:serine/threonine protein kinase
MKLAATTRICGSKSNRYWRKMCKPRASLNAPLSKTTACRQQARGKGVDQRTDLWAFGCLFYELLTGKRAFQGETGSQTIAAALEQEPDWQALPAKTPAKIRELLRRCLQKDVSRRPESMADARRIASPAPATAS